MRSEDHLICQGRIEPTKGCLELAQMARAAEVPILFVGKPFDLRSDYWRRFSELEDNRYVKHHEHMATEASWRVAGRLREVYARILNEPVEFKGLVQ
jgi:hypothetical protein